MAFPSLRAGDDRGGTGNVTIKEYGFLTKAELDTEFAHWHDQMRGWINGFIRAQQGNG